MEYLQHKELSNLPGKKISIELAMKLLKNNGIDVNEQEAKIILKFLYILSKNQIRY